jgi:hypothetical protein
MSRIPVARITAAAFNVTCPCGNELTEPTTGSYIWCPADIPEGMPKTADCPSCQRTIELRLPQKVRT